MDIVTLFDILFDLRYVIAVVAIIILSAIFWRNLSEDPIKKCMPRLSIRGYSMVYSDTRGSSKNRNVQYSKLLRSEKYDITGKPDYIYKKNFGRALIPVELKSGEIKQGSYPRDGDLLQLVAYFLIIEETFGVRPRKGHLIYRDYMFKIRNTRRLRLELLYVLEEMREMLKSGRGTANASFVNCRHCVCRGTVCTKCQQK